MSVSDLTQKPSLRFLTYNVCGLLSKLENDDFVRYVTSFDIVCLTETFIGFDFQSDLFKDFKIFTAAAKKLSHHGRQSGGVMVLVNNSYAAMIDRIQTDVENTVVLKIKNELLGCDKDTMLIASYVPPCDSPFWKTTQNGYGLELLDKCVLDLYDKFDDFNLLFCGDFNARTGLKKTVTVLTAILKM